MHEIRTLVSRHNELCACAESAIETLQDLGVGSLRRVVPFHDACWLKPKKLGPTVGEERCGRQRSMNTIVSVFERG